MSKNNIILVANEVANAANAAAKNVYNLFSKTKGGRRRRGKYGRKNVTKKIRGGGLLNLFSGITQRHKDKYYFLIYFEHLTNLYIFNVFAPGFIAT